MKAKYWLLLLLGVLGVVAVFAMSASATDWVGDQNISAYRPVSSDTLNVYGNVTVQGSGWLDLTDVVLTMRCPSEGLYTLKVEPGGKLTCNGGSISTGTAFRFKFVVEGQMSLEGVTVSQTWGTGSAFDPTTGGDPDLSGLRGGIQIYSSSVYIGNCTLEGGLLTMVYVSGATPTVRGCIIKDVEYNVKSYSQDWGEPSTTKYSAMAFGAIVDAGAALFDSCEFQDIGTFSTMAGVYYREASTNDNEYHVIAAGVAVRNTEVRLDSNTITRIGVLTKASDSFVSGSNTVNQYFYQYRVAGAYAVHARGSTVRGNSITASAWGLWVDVDTTAGLPPMTFDVIIDNVLSQNAMGGVLFQLKGVRSAVAINISDNDIDNNGADATTGLEDSGIIVAATNCQSTLTVVMEQNIIGTNRARGALIDVRNHAGALTVRATNGNRFQSNGGAGLKVYADTIQGDVTLDVQNTTVTLNGPAAFGDMGALMLEGGAISGTLYVKLAATTVSVNTGSGFSVALGSGMSEPNHAGRTFYTIHNCEFSDNTQTGVYIFDNYATNGQNTVFDWANVRADRDLAGVYVHSHAALGNVKMNVVGLTATDNGINQRAVRMELRAATFQPRTLLREVNIIYSADTPGATGLSMQGVDGSNRWQADIQDSLVLWPGPSLDVEFCNIIANNCNFTTTTSTTINARDSRVDLYYCRMPELSASVSSNTLNAGVFFYRWFNVTKVSWQNGAPIKNTTVTIKRYRDPRDEVYTAKTDVNGLLTYAQVPYWVKDDINTPLRNDELQAFIRIANEELNSQVFNFNDTAFGIDDPSTPEVIVSTPAPNTIQKVGDLVILGEIRDAHSGIAKVEATVDNIVWYNATGLEGKVGTFKASFRISIPNLVDNIYKVRVRGWDVARFPNESLGVTIVEIANVKVDTEPPYLIVESPPTEHWVTNYPLLQIVGRTEGSKNIRRLTINDLRVEILGITFNYTSELVEGANTFIIIAEDTAGNIAVVTRQVVLDTLPPTLIVTSPDPGFSSNDQFFEVAGDSEQTADIWVKLDERAEELVENRPTGGTRFSHVITITKEGTHTLRIRAVDEATNEAVVTLYIKYDTTPPFIDVEAPVKDQITNVQTVYVAGSTDVEVRQITVNELTFPVINGLFALEVNLLEGAQNLTISLHDAAGNLNSTRIPLTIDVTPPHMVQLTVESSEPGSEARPITDGMIINTHTVRFRLRLDKMDYRAVFVRVGNDNRSALPDESGMFYRDFNLDEGENTVTFFVVDIAGNKETRVFKIFVDTRPPTIRFFAPKLNSNFEATVNDDTLVISGVMEEEGVTLMIQNKPIPVQPGTGNFNTVVGLDPGVNNIEVYYHDEAGNDDSLILRIRYEEKGEAASPTKDLLGKIWWVFVLAAAIFVVLVLTVRMTRAKWLREHPELQTYDDQRGGYYQDEYQGRRGGGY
jgi:hypothetical protein